MHSDQLSVWVSAFMCASKTSCQIFSHINVTLLEHLSGNLCNVWKQDFVFIRSKSLLFRATVTNWAQDLWCEYQKEWFMWQKKKRQHLNWEDRSRSMQRKHPAKISPDLIWVTSLWTLVKVSDVIWTSSVHLDALRIDFRSHDFPLIYEIVIS